MLEINKIIILGNDEEYIVLDKVTNGKDNYYYIAEVNETKTDIKDNYKIVIVKEENNKKYIEEITGEDKLKEILPLFLDKDNKA